jgi:hypothetical protein
MKTRRLKPGYYWVRFEGLPTIAERVRYDRGTYSGFGRFGGCDIKRDHWHVINSIACFQDSEVCELLSGRLELAGSGAGALAPQIKGLLNAAGVQPSSYRESMKRLPEPITAHQPGNHRPFFFVARSGNVAKAEFAGQPDSESIGILAMWGETPSRGDAAEFDQWARSFYSQACRKWAEKLKEKENQ